MGGKSIRSKHDNFVARKKLAHGSGMKDFMEARAAAERGPIHMDEVVCQKCSFKARYKFIRCPECNELQN